MTKGCRAVIVKVVLVKDLHARNIGHHADQEGDSSPPVESVLSVSISPVSSVEARNIKALAMHDPVVSSQQSSNRRQKDAETAHESQERRGGVDNLPRLHDPRRSDGGQDDASPDIDPLGK